MPSSAPMTADVVVIGAGQAGLSAAHHLLRRGLLRERLLVLDASPGPGGAWQHRWPTLTLSTVNGVHDLPGMAFTEVLNPGEDPTAVPASDAIPRYFAEYERREGLSVRRPVSVRCVTDLPGNAELPEGSGLPSGSGLPGGSGSRGFRVESTELLIEARAIVNATGSWERPFIPWYPGIFGGRQLHTRDYRGPAEFAGQRVLVVGGGISAVGHLEEISQVAETTWVTRTPPIFTDEPFTPEVGRAAVARVEERVRAGLPPGSVVSVTGLPWNPRYRAAQARGALDRLPMFSELTLEGARWADGSSRDFDVILWATGFRSALDHLAPLRLRGPGGGITMTGRLATQVQGRPLLHLIGYGPSASTIGANRAGRAVAAELMAAL